MPTMPMFPLGSVLVPSMVLPLHVFEERYRQLVRDCLDSTPEFGVVLISRGSEVGGGDVRTEVGTVARMVEAAELPDGRFNILLRGEARVRLTELSFVPPFRRAEAVVVPDEGDEPAERDLLALHSLVNSFTATIRAQNTAFDFQLPPNLPGSIASNLVAQHLVLDAGTRQELLETLDPSERVRRVLDVLALQHSALGKRSGKSVNLAPGGKPKGRSPRPTRVLQNALSELSVASPVLEIA